MADVVDDRLVGNVVDVLHVITRLGSIGHLLPVSVVDSLKNIDATRRHSPRNAHYRKILRDKPPSEVSAFSSCTLPPLQHISSSASFQTHQEYTCCFVDRFALDRLVFRFSSHALAHCEWKESSFGRDLGCGIPRNGVSRGRKGGCFGEMKKFRGNLGELDSGKNRMSWLSICPFGMVISSRIKKGACKEGYVGGLHH